MKSSVASQGRSTSKIITQIRKVRKAADKAAGSKNRFADYRYLRSVLSAYRYFENSNLLLHLAEIAPSVLRTPVRKHWTPLRVIIEASRAQANIQMRSRWTRGLEYALAENIEPEELGRFFRANNGIAGCADLASKTRPKRAKSPAPVSIEATTGAGSGQNVESLEIRGQPKGQFRRHLVSIS